METENDLKDIWQSGTVKVKKPVIDPAHKQKHADIISSIRHTLKVENAFNIVFTVLVIIWMVLDKAYLIGIGFLVIMIPGIMYYLHFIKKLNAVRYDTDVNHYLHDVYKFFARFINHYKIFGYIAIVVGFGFGINIYSDDFELRFEKLKTFFSSPISIVLIVFGILLVNLITYLIYGRKKRILKKMLEEFE
ncbi:MAG: hypothetical protein AAFX87_02035 [Bacteroidota bacterium]